LPLNATGGGINNGAEPGSKAPKRKNQQAHDPKQLIILKTKVTIQHDLEASRSHALRGNAEVARCATD